ncbi:MAG: hypothetical protein RLZZ401_1512, partial [Pseudomonadota bacterium]
VRFGVARLKAELSLHQLPDEITQVLVQTLRASEFERALAVWERRFGTRLNVSEDRIKQMRFLAGRGFAGDVIRQVMRHADQVDTPEDPG